MALTDKLSNIAEAIRTKTETTGTMTLAEMPDKILGIQTSEDLDTELTEQQQLISELKTTLENKAAGGVTINNQNKTITENGTYTADEGYTGLGTVTVSVAPPPSDIDALIDRSITEVSSNATRVGANAFDQCKKLVSVNFPNATNVGEYAFRYCVALSEVNIPLMTYLDDYMFQGCTMLETIDLPNVTDVLGNASGIFENCHMLKNVKLPKLKAVSNYMFRFTKVLKILDFPSVSKITSYGLQDCVVLIALVLRNNGVCALQSADALKYSYHFYGTVNATYNPEGLKDGYIYVPRDLVESYKSATNWSTFATQFRALEDYTVDGTTTGALDESKI